MRYEIPGRSQLRTKAQLRRALMEVPRARDEILLDEMRANFYLTSRQIALVWTSDNEDLRRQICDGSFYAVDAQLRRDLQARGVPGRLAARLEDVRLLGHFEADLERVGYFYYITCRDAEAKLTYRERQLAHNRWLENKGGKFLPRNEIEECFPHLLRDAFERFEHQVDDAPGEFGAPEFGATMTWLSSLWLH